MGDLVDVVEAGDRRATLEALRGVLASQFDGAKAYETVGLAKELRAVLKELAELPAAKEANPVDDQLAARRRRQADAKVS